MIQLEDVHKVYGGRAQAVALGGVSLTVEKGEMVALMGPSGSGKSTLLNIVGGLDVPTSGTVKVAGKDLSKETEDGRALFRRKHAAYIFQAFHLMPTLSAAENVALPLHLAGKSSSTIATRVDEALKAVGLLDRRRHLPDELSGGERQRVAIARALVTDAALLLADEPTGNLDSARGEEILALLRRLVEERGLTVLMVTHDPHAAEACARVVRMRDGRIEDQSRVARSRSVLARHSA